MFQETATNIAFKDHLFPGSAVLSLGIECRELPDHDSKKDNVSSWSLALSHLRYYGTPIKVKSEDLQRVTIKQLWVVTLGALLYQWQVSISNLGLATQWFKRLGDTLATRPQSQGPQFSWILKLCDAATFTLETDDLESKKRMSLLQFGWRRATKFLGRAKQVRPPFFGLCNPDVMESLKQETDTEIGFEYLRRVASRLQLSPKDAIIYHSRTINGVKFKEWVTIAPVHPVRVDDSPPISPHNWRWIYSPNQSIALDQRRQQITQRGEICDIIHDEKSTPQDQWKKSRISEANYTWTWNNPPAVLGEPDFPLHYITSHETVKLQKETYGLLQSIYRSRMSTDAMVVDLKGGFEWLGKPQNAEKLVNYLIDFLRVSTVQTITKRDT